MEDKWVDGAGHRKGAKDAKLIGFGGGMATENAENTKTDGLRGGRQ